MNHGYLGLRTNTGISWQVGKILSVWYKAYPPGGSSSAPALIIPELQSKPSIISLSYTIPDIVPLGDISHPFNPQNFKIAHSFDGLKWTILSESVVDRVNMTVATVNKVGGYYMIVSSEF